jgi:hypothetical protein
MSCSLRSVAARTRSVMPRSSPSLVAGLARATSTSVRTIARGVRSSWEALATKRRWLEKAASSRPSIASKVSASSFSSPCGPSSAIRSRCRFCPESRLAAAVTAWSGRRIRPATTQPSHSDTTAISPSASPDHTISCRYAAVSTARA